MADLVLDASFLIDLTRNVARALAFAREGSSARFLLHPASEAEVLVGARDRTELRILVAALGGFRRARPTDDDFDHCIAFVRRYSLSHGIGWPDCLIAATALRLALPIVTLNDKHFAPIRGLRVVRPY